MSTPQTCSIEKIPAEILLKIIKISVTEFNSDKRRLPPCNLLDTLSMVCSTWRDVIRGAPELWTTIYGSEPPSQMRAAIQFSQKMPLRLYGDDGKNPIPGRAANILFAEFYRMSVFEMYLRQDDFRSNVSLLGANCNTSLLESFALWIEGPEEDGGDEEQDTALDLFGGKAPPRLTKLSIGGCKHSWDSAAFGNLTSLRISSPNRCGSQCFVDALSRMPFLEELFLTRCVPLNFGLEDITMTVDFPRLSTLSFDDQISLCIALLRRVRFQRLAHLIVIAESFEREDNEEYAALFDVCRSHLELYFETYPAYHLAVETTLYSMQATALSMVDEQSGQLEDVLSITLEAPTEGRALVDAELLALSFNMIPGHEVRSFQCYLPHQFHPHFWTRTVSTAFPHLEGLFVDEKTLRGVMVALFQEIPGRIAQTQEEGVYRQELAFPNLRHLIAPMTAPPPPIFTAVLTHRQASGLPLSLTKPMQ
ncbi:hypothetical protein CCMSSC00406_0006364 [Pleurotus cornucopiae]|uniref:Uncharacterized protein n=1 Tax=Pleurotus cornucopiae TaxID=5321 RepID=A0ACB7IRZ3_PLECO|nr:hypothetical protein CCMSSC00406_0006364 [Pleurotus cornucopiae]